MDGKCTRVAHGLRAMFVCFQALPVVLGVDGGGGGGGGGRGGEGSSHPWQRVKGRVCVFPIVAPFHRDYSPVKIFSQLSDNDWKNHPTSLSLSLFPSFLVYFSILVNTAVQFRWKNYINRELVNWQIRRDVI